MKIRKEVKFLIHKLIQELSKGNYSIIKEPPFQSRCNPKDIGRTIKDYGKTMVDLPIDAIDSAWTLSIRNEKSKYNMDIDLWTEEQGQSDLTLQLTVSDQNKIVVEIEDLHIL